MRRTTYHAIGREMGSIRDGRPAKYQLGHRFGELVLLERYGNRAILECSCGNTIEVSMTALTSGGKSDCGHIAAARASTREKPGDMLYWTWKQMLDRCEDANHPAYKDYGGRGIKVCEAWHDFQQFKSDIGARPDGYTLDRMNNNGNYEPSNCRWATVYEQAQNKRKPQKSTPEEGIDI